MFITWSKYGNVSRTSTTCASPSKIASPENIGCCKVTSVSIDFSKTTSCTAENTQGVSQNRSEEDKHILTIGRGIYQLSEPRMDCTPLTASLAQPCVNGRCGHWFVIDTMHGSSTHYSLPIIWTIVYIRCGYQSAVQTMSRLHGSLFIRAIIPHS